MAGVEIKGFEELQHFHSLNELNVDHVAHLFEVFRAIGRAVPCGVMIVHHHRKTARSQVEYEVVEDMTGSGALFGEADSIVSIYRKVRRSDDTRRYKVVFDLRHAETPDPMELFRMGGENSIGLVEELPSDYRGTASARMTFHFHAREQYVRTLSACSEAGIRYRVTAELRQPQAQLLYPILPRQGPSWLAPASFDAQFWEQILPPCTTAG